MPAHMLPKPRKGAATAMRRARTRLAHARFLAACVRVRERDAGRCRVCGAAGWAEVHHIRYRSRGGSDDLSNLVLLCKACHDAVHAGRLRVRGTSEALMIEQGVTEKLLHIRVESAE